MKNTERRDFLKQLALVVASLPFIGKVTDALAGLPQGATEVTATDPTAVALGYVADAKKADEKKYGQKAKDAKAGKQKCSSCMFYAAAKDNKEYGNCQLFPGKVVRAAGWCNSYNPKPAG